MPKKQHKSNSSLGKTLLNIHKEKYTNKKVVDADGRVVKVHTTDIQAQEARDAMKKRQLQSILEQNSLDEFVQYAEMSQKQFTAEKLTAQQVVPIDSKVVGLNQFDQEGNIVEKFLEGKDQVQNPSYKPLKIPRRPEWTKEMKGVEINQRENQAFLEWRRDIAQTEENNVKLAITPFEKNIEVWRQLWRVIEKSDLLLQIVDARNPYFYYSADLEKYIQEVSDFQKKIGERKEGEGKRFILCINKADYLSEDLIKHWNNYFREKNVNHVFISAKKEQEKLDAQETDSEEEDYDEEAEASEEEKKEYEPILSELKKEVEEETKEEQIQEKQQKKQENSDKFNDINTTKVFGRVELLKYLRDLATLCTKNPENRLNVGTIGYPNVGKSSIINVMCGRKRVGVAAMPGKTKHFQTLLLEGQDRNICLVDCPGLVFPSFANSRAEMYCCGVLQIGNITDYLSPVGLIVQRIPQHVLESFYKIRMPPKESENYNASTFLATYALKKGWITGGSSNPNIAQAARQILIDYTTGKIVFCHLRPDFNLETHGQVAQAGFNQEFLPNIIEENEEESVISGEQDQSQQISQISTNNISTQKVKVQPGAIPQSTMIQSGHALVLNQNEQKLDDQFFSSLSTQPTKLKLNKAEKRALKFMMKREGAGQEGDELDLNNFEGDAKEIKALLQSQTENKHKKYIETGGGQKRKQVGARGIGNNSNKLI